MNAQKTSWMTTFPLSMLAKPWQGVKRPGLPLSAPPAGYDVVRILLGLVLLTAAGLKGYQLATEPTLEKGLLTSRWFLIGQVEFELALGIFLLSGLYKRLVWLVTLVCFVGFSCVTLYKGLSGEASCGCFGKAQVSPWYTLILDLGAILGLLTLPHRRNTSRRDFPDRQTVIVTGTLTFLITISSGLAMALLSPAPVSPEGGFMDDGSVVVFEPEVWVGRPLPLLKYIDAGERISLGRWIVILYHQDCENCRTMLAEIKSISQRVPKDTRRQNVALVRVPSHKSEDDLSGLETILQPAKLNNDRDWVISTPCICLLEDGRVRKAWNAWGPDVASICSQSMTVK